MDKGAFMSDDLKKLLKTIALLAYTRGQNDGVGGERRQATVDEAVDQIERAVVADGWHMDGLGVTANESYMHEWMKLRGYMKGQEFYDRFVAVYDEQRDRPQLSDGSIVRKQVMEHAKKAAGIES